MKIYEDKKARQIAKRLSPKSRAYLLEDEGSEGTKNTLIKYGCLDVNGRLTPHGVRIARALREDSAWTADDSAALDAEIRASRKPRAKVTKKADPDLADACRKILKYPLKERSTYRMKGDGLSGFGRNEPTRAFS